MQYELDDEFFKNYEKLIVTFNGASKENSGLRHILYLNSNYFPSSEDASIGLASFNEVRNALFHIFKCYVENPQFDVSEELESAKIHYIRGLYDAYEDFLKQSIDWITAAFDYTDLHLVNKYYPKYQSEIIPEVLKLKSVLAEERVTKRKNISSSSQLIKEKCDVIIKYIEEVKRMQTTILHEKAKTKTIQSQFNLKNISRIAIEALAIAIVISFINWIMQNPEQSGHPFRFKADSHSGAKRTPIPF
ncbi:MAG: hypothetical protein K9G70_14055 [Prolixibacteraceae bacterium]|nr:hypothetical protein [Prolixibacteraceae bacterium]